MLLIRGEYEKLDGDESANLHPIRNGLVDACLGATAAERHVNIRIDFRVSTDPSFEQPQDESRTGFGDRVTICKVSR